MIVRRRRTCRASSRVGPKTQHRISPISLRIISICWSLEKKDKYKSIGKLQLTCIVDEGAKGIYVYVVKERKKKEKKNRLQKKKKKEKYQRLPTVARRVEFLEARDVARLTLLYSSCAPYTIVTLFSVAACSSPCVKRMVSDVLVRSSAKSWSGLARATLASVRTFLRCKSRVAVVPCTYDRGYGGGGGIAR